MSIETKNRRSKGPSEEFQPGIPGVFPNSMTDDIVDFAVLGRLPTSGFSEFNIANALGFNTRTGVREAMRILVHDGVLGVRPQAGYWLLEPTIEEAQLSMRSRADAAGMLVERMASSSTLITAGNLEAVKHEMGRESEPQRFIKLESQFYSQIAAVAKDRFTYGLIEGCNNRLRVYHALNPVTPEQMAGKVVWAETQVSLLQRS